MDKFDVTGPFEFKDQVLLLEEFHTIAEAARPDLKAAVQAIDKAQTDHKLAVANGSTDPTFGMDFARNPPIPLYVGFSVNIPVAHLRPQSGREGAHPDRYQLMPSGRRKRPQAQVFSDVDTAYFTLISSVNLLKPYQGPMVICRRPRRVRDTMSFSYQRGQAALLDYLDAQRDYRATEVAYINLVARLHDRGQPVESRRRPRSAAVERAYVASANSASNARPTLGIGRIGVVPNSGLESSHLASPR